MKNHTAKAVATHGNGGNGKANRNARPKGRKHDANLQKRGAQRFQVGLILALLLVYIGLEASFRNMETSIRETDEKGIAEVVEYYPELAHLEIEVPKSKEVSPPVVVVNPTTFEIVPDTQLTDIAKEFVSVPETSAPDLDLNAIPVVDENPEPTEVSFIVVEDVPIFPGCEKVEKSERRTCFNEKMKKHIKRHFKYPDLAHNIGQEGRVDIFFKIGLDGNVTDVQMRGPSKILEEEAARIIGKLPKMTPGKQRGTPVRVPFSIPITFRLN